MIMQTGLERFNYYLNILDHTIKNAEKFENPGLEIYSKNVRTQLFMLEALTRIYKKISSKKIFKSLQKQFKELEDQLGKIDYYDSYLKKLKLLPNLPDNLLKWIDEKKSNEIQQLNLILQEKKWIGSKGQRIIKIKENLSKVNWLNEKQECDEIKNIIHKEINKLGESIKEDKLNFSNVETGLHELRRKLRWLSIYPNALRGVIVLDKPQKAVKSMQKYLTTEVKQSPFNTFVIDKTLSNYILFSRNHFYALSWVIAKLGTLKDEGLCIELLQNYFESVKKINKNNAKLATQKLLRNKNSIEKILAQAKIISSQFFNEKILEKLVI